MSTLAVVLPGWPQLHRAGVLVTVVVAGGGAVLLTLLAERITRGVCHAFTASGTVLIAACQVLAGGGSATATYGMLYIWVVLHCALFFPAGVIAIQLGLTTIAHVLALLWLDDLQAVGPQLALTLGTQLASALVVGSLATKMRHLADTDALTGLHNRRSLDRALGHHLARARRAPSMATWLAVLDLDGFKAFNDRHGHAAGDQLLVDAAAAWRDLVRDTDLIARTGGDEFTVVLPNCDSQQAERIVRRLTAAVPAAVSCSAGLARWDSHEAANDLIQRADTALYTAKATGPLVIAAHL